MECNKDEATRAKEIAEKKFTAKDMAGAKKFALKAQSLYPELEGINQLLATLNVYVSAENKVHGESDWYGILGVSPMADEETIRKQFRKLALVLHPDKNKSIGADGAFKLISEALSMLSDKVKRAAYDQKRRARIFQRVSTATARSTGPPPGANGFSSFTKRTNPPPSTKVHKAASERAGHSQSSQKQQPGTFWTVCHRCKTQFEYLRAYVNHNLLCPNCRVPFYAVERSPPTLNGNVSSKPWNFSLHQKGGKNQASSKGAVNKGGNNMASSGGHDSSTQQTFHWAPFKGAGNGASTAAQAATVVQQAYEQAKRVREEAQAASKREETLRRKQAHKKGSGPAGTALTASSYTAAKRSTGDNDVNNHAATITDQTGVQSGFGGAGVIQSFASKQGNLEMSRFGGTVKLNMFREVPQNELQRILVEKARTKIRQKLDEWGGAVKVNREDRKEDHSKVEEEPLAEVNSEKAGTKARASKVVSGINVPDSDFHDFDLDRTEKSFGENEIWAAYDGNDGMPRYYALIQNVISLHPFKLQISWLNSKSNTEFGSLSWVGLGFMKTCGEFRVGKYETNSSLNSFSHKVRWMKGARGVICIYPRKGDVWALYRNWSPDWNETTTGDIIHKYDMVEVLEDYDEERGGVTVVPLVKVAGFKTVFCRHLDPKEIRRIPREEMFRFSHHVPSRLLTGKEARGAPRGCWELDPAATPLELIHATTVTVQETENRETFVNEGTSDIEYDVRAVKRRKKNGEESGAPEIIDVEDYLQTNSK
ncbi:uncharacterized protein LOC116211207 [Punica granatum]|uniref:J domain-containing protein n=2 Tax=Punica granatum TaxID=22663 RepID=A0A218WTW3_PUNGR|nr:uncharacterized protein LOC116211207 [Punica granatum]OWM76215.1 hypothetical protein CDL15_Pgr009861 [Punica granatum]PKI76993.1 hypothetical protein CRG98_002496 [Punica granatum]